jgi:nitrate reductase alpha subunit
MEWEWAKQNAIDNAENGRVETYAQGQRCDREYRERWFFPKHSRAEAKVL